jgi:hypothetical protein
MRLKAKIDPKVQKRYHEGGGKQFPPNGPVRPEDASVPDLSQPEPFLGPAGDDSPKSDKQDYRGDDESQRPPSREAVIHGNTMLPDYGRPWRLDV